MDEIASYFPPIIEQPLGLGENNPGLNPSFMQISSRECCHETQDNNPGQFSQLSQAEMVKSSFEDSLAPLQKLTFQSEQRLGLGSDAVSMITRIRGSENQLVMSTVSDLTVPTGYTGWHGRHTKDVESGNIISFNDQDGMNLMICSQFSNELILTSGDRLIGIVGGAKIGITCGQTLYVENDKGELFLKIIRKNSAFYFDFNGANIASARVGVINNDEFGVEFLVPLDSTTKAMIIAASYYLYILYHAETSCGCSGTLTLHRCLCLIPMAVILTIVIVFIYTAIAYINIRTRL